MECRLATAEDLKTLSDISVKIGNVPFFPDKCTASILLDDETIIGFVAVQQVPYAAGSWVHEDHRGMKHTYRLRACLDNELRRIGAKVYFSLPGNDFEKMLFAKYGLTTEHLVQMRHL